MELGLKIAVVALAICGAWTVFLMAKSALSKVLPKVSAWWSGEKAVISADINTLKNDVALIKAKLGI